jgi:hypothetical protein
MDGIINNMNAQEIIEKLESLPTTDERLEFYRRLTPEERGAFIKAVIGSSPCVTRRKEAEPSAAD